jgi:general secretion pathway protein C
MAARWVAFLTWALVSASLVFWASRLLVPATPAPPHTQLATSAAGPRGDLSALLGQVAEAAVGVAAPEAPPANNRFTLVGVAAAKGAAGSREGLALIGVDDKPPRAFRVGAVVEGEWVLQSVSARGAQLGPRGGAAAVVLELPPLPPPATGVLGAEGGGPAPPGGPVGGAVPSGLPPGAPARVYPGTAPVPPPGTPPVGTPQPGARMP